MYLTVVELKNEDLNYHLSFQDLFLNYLDQRDQGLSF